MITSPVMELKFIQNKAGYRITLHQAYPVLGFYTDFYPKAVQVAVYLILDDLSCPLFVASVLEGVEVIDAPLTYPVTEEFHLDRKFVLPEFWNISHRAQRSKHDFAWWELRRGELWAVTQFVEGLKHLGIAPNQDRKNLADNEDAKIWYVKGLIYGLFESVCNFFNKSDGSYNFDFEKCNKTSIDLMALANQLFFPTFQTFDTIETLTDVTDYKSDIYKHLYKHVFEYSAFGGFIEQNTCGYVFSKHDRSFLISTIKRIVLVLASIFDYKQNLVVHKLPLYDRFEYSLIFETDRHYYSFHFYFVD